MGRGLRLLESLAWLLQGGRTRSRAGIPGTRSWTLNCTLCRGEYVRNTRVETLGGSVTGITWVAVSPGVLCACVRVCAYARARQPAWYWWLYGRMVVYYCGFVCVCVSVSCFDSEAVIVLLWLCLWPRAYLTGNVLMWQCNCLWTACLWLWGVRQCCCDRVFGSACVTLRFCMCVTRVCLWLRSATTLSVTRGLWLLVSLTWYLVVFFWLSDWMTVCRFHDCMKRVKVLLWKVILGCVCPQQGACVCLSDCVYALCMIGF